MPGITQNSGHAPFSSSLSSVNPQPAAPLQHHAPIAATTILPQTGPSPSPTNIHTPHEPSHGNPLVMPQHSVMAGPAPSPPAPSPPAHAQQQVDDGDELGMC